MNGEKPLQNMMIDYIIHKGSFQNFIAPNSFFKNLDYSSYSYFSCRRLGNVRNVRNTAGVNHSRCCAIAKIPWSLSRLPGISTFQKIGDGYVIAASFLCPQVVVDIVVNRNIFISLFRDIEPMLFEPNLTQRILG